MLLRGKSGSACRAAALSFELKKGVLWFLSSLSGTLQQNLEWLYIDSKDAEVVKERH